MTYRRHMLLGVRIGAPFQRPGPEWGVNRFRCFRVGRPKQTSHSDSRTRNPTPHISWYARVSSGRFGKPNRFPAGIFLVGTTTSAGAEILFGSVTRLAITLGYQEICGVGIQVRETECEVNFGAASRNDPEKRNLLTLRSGVLDQN